MATAQELINQGYGGYAGWGDAEAAADFAATGGSGKQTTGATSGGVVQGTVPDLDISSIPSTLDFTRSLIPAEDQAFQDYLKTQQAQPKPLDIYGQLETQAGLPVLRNAANTLSGQINDVEDTIRMVEPDVSATSRQSIVTEAQRRGMVNARKEPLLEKLGWLGQSLGRITQSIDRATTDIANKVNLAMKGQEMDLEPLKLRINLIADRNARLVTGFTADVERKFDALLAKYNAQVNMNAAETAALNDLVRLEKEYQLKKEEALYQTEQVTVGGRVKLINSATGQVIADLGPSSSGGAGVNTGQYFSSGSAWVIDNELQDDFQPDDMGFSSFPEDEVVFR